MAVTNPPVFIQAGSHPAEDVRRFWRKIFDARGGIMAAGDLAVSENGTPNMSVNIVFGGVLVIGNESTFQGYYYCENRGTENRAIAAADATNPRKDLVVARVKDAAYSGATNSWDIEVVTGTPAPSPAEPAVPANSWVLAMVDVPALDTAITNSQITDRRTSATNNQAGRAAALGGIIVLPTGSGAFPAQQEGRLVYEQSSKRLHVSDGAAYQRIAHAAAAGRTGCRLRRVANQSVATNTLTSISWDTEDDDTDGYITVTNATVTIPAGLGGLYAITCNVVAGVALTGRSLLRIVPTSGITGMPATLRTVIPTTEVEGYVGLVIPLLAGDSFICQVFHLNGVNINWTGWLSCYRLAI